MDTGAAERYVTGLLTKQLSGDMLYHDLVHTRDVVEAAMRLAGLEGVRDPVDLDRLRTAAWFHDCGYVVRYDDHEREGCTLVRGRLPEWGYAENDVEAICGMIMATRMPQQPKTKLEKILCDADLDYLGRDDFDVISRKLLTEWKAHGKDYTESEWDDLQVAFLSSHRYWTESARNLREGKKKEHLSRIFAKR